MVADFGGFDSTRIGKHKLVTEVRFFYMGRLYRCSLEHITNLRAYTSHNKSAKQDECWWGLRVAWVFWGGTACGGVGRPSSPMSHED